MGLIYLDTCLVIYLTEEDPKWFARVSSAVERATDVRFAISPLVQMECLVGPLRRGDAVLQREYLDAFAELEVLGMPEQVFLQAAQLRARFGLKTPDALHLACAQHHRCEGLWTNDNRLAKASHGLARKLSS